MIIGLSHITINTTNFDSDQEILKKDGWHSTGVMRDVHNHPAKKIFLDHYYDTHHIALFKKTGHKTIELIEHHQQNTGKCNVFTLGADGQLGIACHHYDQSLLFWQQGMGFKLEENGHAVLSSPVADWRCDIFLSPSDTAPLSALDKAGVTCLAFYSTDTEHDCVQLKEKFPNILVSDIITLQLAGRNLRIRMLKAPSGELVELIQFEG